MEESNNKRRLQDDLATNKATADQPAIRKSRRLQSKEEEQEKITGPSATAREEMNKKVDEDIKLVPSPNKKTRARRSESKVTCEDNTVERKRIAKILKDFLESGKKHVPCSVYGRAREEEHPGFFFCSQCHAADTVEGHRPGQFINRHAAINGRYVCRAQHTNFSRPTFRDPRSRYVPEAPDAELFCLPTAAPRRKKKKGRFKKVKMAINKLKNSIEDMLFSARCTEGEEPDDDIDPDGVDSRLPVDSFDVDNSVETINESSSIPSTQDTPPSPNANEASSPSSTTRDNTNTAASAQGSIAIGDGCDPQVLSGADERVPDTNEELAKDDLEDEPDEPDDDSSCCDDDEDPPFPEFEECDLNNELGIKIRQLQEELKRVRKESKRKSSQISHLKRKLKQFKDKEALPKSCYTPTARKKIVTYIRELIESKVKRVRENVFHPFKILRAMDLAGGPLNFQGIELLRNVETEGVAYAQTLLPSSACMQDCASVVERFGRIVAPYRILRNSETGAEGFTFRAADVMAAILIAGHLIHGDAKTRSIHLSQSLDGALFTKNLGHVLGGLKFNDVCNILKQSRNSVFPILCVCQHESEALVRSLFRMMMVEIEQGAKIVLPTKFGILEITISTNCDMSCEWKLLGCGGAAGQVTYPCTKCAAKSGELHLPTQPVSECTICHELGYHNQPGWVCRHHKICTDSHLSELEGSVKVLEKEMPGISEKLKDIWKESKMVIEEDPRHVPLEKQKSELLSIHFDLSVATRAKRTEYAKLLTNDLLARDLEIRGTLEERQERLKASHVKEWTYHQATRVVRQFRDSKKATALVQMMDTVPCLLHMENRMGLKLLAMILKDGLENTKNEKLEWLTAECESTRCLDFIASINKAVNRHLIGTEYLPGQWRVPFDTETNQLITICMDNVRIWKVIGGLERIIDLCEVDEERLSLWKESVGHYRKSMQLVNKKTNLSDQEINDYQREADAFFWRWVELHGERGITNYCHLIGSGHIMEYLGHWKNLSAHAQQGWEGE